MIIKQKINTNNTKYTYVPLFDH